MGKSLGLGLVAAVSIPGFAGTMLQAVFVSLLCFSTLSAPGLCVASGADICQIGPPGIAPGAQGLNVHRPVSAGEKAHVSVCVIADLLTGF